jgi:hypothetical protein
MRAGLKCTDDVLLLLAKGGAVTALFDETPLWPGPSPEFAEHDAIG